ncbi:MAG: carbon-nitrogen hydrolase family protein [Hyphomicrobium sp.]|uniref:carbon-nitrogen hydrolase family protein n=1 Tax=Hyphomicrobium sp. TaxID=82 RepID=UPI001329D0F1|nr:carbon-nitrogen hydrolase family protein [Hyphomicrobium sp.]KAB2943906.1 MAG: carbon-nitrogen hydrolase family protein [Hyphomicrobium sp.]MBZ0208811.1 carbon-nitrogen hydrolase family protein [Hyphomicrobium sp.]
MADAPKSFRVGLVQMCAGRSVARNIDAASELIRAAARGGAQYVQTPEMTNILELERERLLPALRLEADDPGVTQFRFLARELGLWLHVGSLALLGEGGKPVNRSLLISPEGRITARYDKIHMFDVDLPGGETYRESANYQPGREAVVATLPWGQLGMTICYDLRFPHLHRALAKAGAQFLAVPAAFTKPTGTAHWHTLLRARAIECQCYVFAAAQGGRHEIGRETFGHSLVISPWGEVLAEGGVQPAVTFADVELQRLEDVRRQVPSLRHDRPFDVVYAVDTLPDEVAS